MTLNTIKILVTEISYRKDFGRQWTPNDDISKIILFCIKLHKDMLPMKYRKQNRYGELQYES